MGTDIHGVFQRHNGTAWEDIPSTYEQNRHYQLFAVLAGVRNGYGFAGVPIGEAVKPIAEPRGLPSDFAVTDDSDSHPVASIDHFDPRRRKWHEAGEPLEVWMGDHSHSWLTGAEMLAWQPPRVVKTGVLSRNEYDAWDKVSAPQHCSGDVWGRDVVKINDSAVEKDQQPNWTHIRCHWEQELRHELAYFFDEVKRLADEYGQIRFVFGFDS